MLAAIVVIGAALFVAFVPALLYVLFFRLLDIFEKEPLWLVVAAFAWGAIPAVIFAGLFEFLGGAVYSAAVNADPGAVEFVSAGVLAPLIEEIGKAAFLACFFVLFRRQIDSPLDGLIVGATIGLGFAASENAVYMVGGFLESGAVGFAVTAFLRIVLLGFGHALFTGATGLGFAYIRFGRGPWKVFGPILGLMSGIALHALWNGILVVGGSGLAVLAVLTMHWGIVGAMLVLVGFLLARERVWMQAELNEEVMWGLVTPAEARRACSVWPRIGMELGALFTAGAGSVRSRDRFYRNLSALALCKHNLRQLNDDPRAPNEIQVLRARLAPERARARIA